MNKCKYGIDHKQQLCYSCLQDSFVAQAEEIARLKSILFVIGEIAVVDFQDNIVGIVDRTLAGWEMDDKESFLLLKTEFLKGN